uniref:Ras-interacting protein RIP3-like isoform X1 n=1 Tax=Drosophila rhopaloa TaxID=1041015 RepID=A0A6P4ENB3_DRORH
MDRRFRPRPSITKQSWKRLFGSLPKYTQHLLVLLFGTFRVIASNAAHASTGMTSEALGVSVAPSFFQSCVSDGKTARMEDVLKFKVSTKIMQNIIDKFATHDIFGRDNYEYYARVTGRILKVQDEWICSFQYPPPPRGKLAQQKYALQHSLEAEKTWLQCQCERWGLLAQEESRSTPALLTSSSSALENSVLSLGVSPEHSFIESCARLSVSLEGPGIFAMTSSPLPAKRNGNGNGNGNATDYDYDDYADDDEDNDELDGVQDFGAELEISSIAPPQGSRGIYRHKQRSQQPHHYQQQRQVQPPQPDYADDDDEDEDEMTFVKRRYRQNKKKPVPPSSSHHQRRLRTGTKSLDGGGERRAGSVSGAAGSVLAPSGPTAGDPTPPKLKQRTCSRCNRGIRHSSSCSSNSAGATGSNCAGGGSGGSGGGNGGGAEGGMTMEELRAVNRYAESTKSLSYLPQVHERQTARMRTRSEWFLGPRDAVVTLQLPADTCSNCCLAAAAGYLGGGSTRDMRQAQTEGERNQAALLYHFYRRQQQQQQQQEQEQHFDDMMDTEDSYGQQKEQQQQQQQQIHSKGLLRPPPMQHQQQQQQRRLLLDVNSGSYNAGLTTLTTNNTNFGDDLAFYLHEPLDNTCYYSSHCLNRLQPVVVVQEEPRLVEVTDSDGDSLDGGGQHTLQAHELQQHVEPRQAAMLLLRHSTPQQQRRSSMATSLYQSFEVTSTDLPQGDNNNRVSQNDSTGSNNNHNNFATVIFNVLDFLF